MIIFITTPHWHSLTPDPAGLAIMRLHNTPTENENDLKLFINNFLSFSIPFNDTNSLHPLTFGPTDVLEYANGQLSGKRMRNSGQARRGRRSSATSGIRFLWSAWRKNTAARFARFLCLEEGNGLTEGTEIAQRRGWREKMENFKITELTPKPSWLLDSHDRSYV